MNYFIEDLWKFSRNCQLQTVRNKNQVLLLCLLRVSVAELRSAMIKIIKHGALICTMVVSLPANAAVLYATAANISSIWQSASEGDTIKLSGVFADTVALQNKTVSNAITIDATQATFTATLKLQAVSGIRVVGGTFDATGGPNAYGKAIVVYSSSNVSFDQTNVVSTVGYPEAGISFQGVTNGQVTNSTFANVGVGVGVTGSSHITLTGNKVVGATKDGFDIYNDHSVLVSNNSCSGGQPSAGAHPDCVQLASTKGLAPSSDIRVINNTATGATQGFTSFLGSAGGNLNVAISGNIVNTTFSQGVACYGCVDSFITDNFISAQPGAAHFINLNVIGGTNNVVTGNTWLTDAVYLPNDYAAAYRELTGTAYVAPNVPGAATPGSSPSTAQLVGTNSVVPEPGEWMMLLLGFATIGMAQRRRATMIAN